MVPDLPGRCGDMRDSRDRSLGNLRIAGGISRRGRHSDFTGRGIRRTCTRRLGSSERGNTKRALAPGNYLPQLRAHRFLRISLPVLRLSIIEGLLRPVRRGLRDAQRGSRNIERELVAGVARLGQPDAVIAEPNLRIGHVGQKGRAVPRRELGLAHRDRARQAPSLVILERRDRSGLPPEQTRWGDTYFAGEGDFRPARAFPSDRIS